MNLMPRRPVEREAPWAVHGQSEPGTKPALVPEQAGAVPAPHRCPGTASLSSPSTGITVDLTARIPTKVGFCRTAPQTGTFGLGVSGGTDPSQKAEQLLEKMREAAGLPFSSRPVHGVGSLAMSPGRDDQPILAERISPRTGQ